ncbi:(4Fe-4S)-binding protein [Solitalea lacus]|uniref:(4Fe-4S)-binding protein n=1 Tax=Solitalea lacus TaxID=2911172 RepID=UPI001EDABF3D|nr:(4Fe-4S)-binding protein [Solitalea lacus]UKJ06603.1 (4Fe-4S)-binding protein [Solitalea lacus]
MEKQNLKKEYTNGEVTVVWQNAKCIHSGICFKGLPQVFDPRRRPWISILGADTQKIIDQVKRCPSGALSYYMNGKKNKDGTT